MSPRTEAELLLLARAGNGDALDELIRSCQPAVYRFGLRMCRDEEDARDVLQDTLVALARSIKDIRGTSKLSTWLYAVARSFCIKNQHKHRSARTASGRFGMGAEVQPSLSANSADLVDDTRNPEQALIALDTEKALRRALATLTAEHREVVVLRDGEGLTAQEVAGILEISSEAVKSRLHRARIALRNQLAPMLGIDVRAPAQQHGCPDILATYSRHLENEVSADLCHAMMDHLNGCPHCTLICDSLKGAIAACGAAAPEPVPREVQEDVRRAMREVMDGLATSRK